MVGRAWGAMAALVVALGGCGDDGGGEGSDTAVSAEVESEVETEVESEVESEVEVESETETDPWIDEGSFRFSRAAISDADFYAFPWPSALRTLPSGAADLSAFRIPSEAYDLLPKARDAIQAGPPGFSPLASVYVGLRVAIDPATLPADAAASMTADSAVQLIDIEPGSPDFGKRLPITVEWNEAGGGYWPAKTLALHPNYQLPPRMGDRYAAVLTTKLRAANGSALTPPAVIAGLGTALAATPVPPEAEALRPLYDRLGELGLAADDILVATVWQAAEPLADLDQLVTWLRQQPVPTIHDFKLVERRQTYDLYEGVYESEEYFSDEPPYTNFGEGLLAVGADGAPVSRKPVSLTFTLTMPKGKPPAAGYPIVLYSHGLGEDHAGFLRVAAAPLGARGVAVIGLDPPLQGGRNTTTYSDRDLIVQLSIQNIMIGREIVRQGVLDVVRLHALVADSSFMLGQKSPDDHDLAIDLAHIGFMGHSEGAQIGALLLPYLPTVGPAVISEGGGGAAITMLALNLDGVPIGDVVAGALGIDANVERWVLGHPLITSLIQPLLDPADPLHVARMVLLEPPAGSKPHDLVMLEGFLDALTPPTCIEALASAFGLPIAEPVARTIEGLTLQGIGSVPLPASGNMPEIAGKRATAVLLQLPNNDHYTVYTDPKVRIQLFDFLQSALVNTATIAPIPPPPTR